MKQTDSLKSTMYYPREYRHFPWMRKRLWLYLLLCVLPVTLVFVVFYSDITMVLCGWAQNVVSGATGQEVKILGGGFLPWFGDVHYLELQGAQPTTTHAVASAIVCFAALLIFSQIDNSSRPFIIYLCMGLFVQLISSLFFVFIPQLFPYTLEDYSLLYMTQQVSLWIVITVICGISTALLSPTGVGKYVAFFITVIYLFVFGCVRYVVYLMVLYYCSLIYMATLFFTFGCLFDFLQLVAIYAIFAKHMSTLMSTGRRRAEWLWS